MAIVTDVYKSTDGFVRNCELKYKQIMPDGKYDRKVITIRRPVQRFIVVAPVGWQ